MTIAVQGRLLRLGAAKRLTQANLHQGMQEGEDLTDRWGV